MARRQNSRHAIARQVTPCQQCPLRGIPGLRKMDREQLAFVSSFKVGELVCEAGATILVEGTHSPHLYTVLSGWGFRTKLLEDGRRQVLNYIMPGDFIGLQSALFDEMEHSVEALSDMILCVFERDRIFSLFEKQPSLAYGLTWLGAREERMLDNHLLSVGRRTALERASYLLAFLLERASALGLIRDEPTIRPITQQIVADTLGLSLVHTNKTLAKLIDRKLIEWGEEACTVRDADGLKSIAGWDGGAAVPRLYL